MLFLIAMLISLFFFYVYLFIYLSFYLSIYLYIYLSIYWSLNSRFIIVRSLPSPQTKTEHVTWIYLCFYNCLSIYLSIIYQSTIYLSIYLSIHHLSIYLSIYPSSIHLSIDISILIYPLTVFYNFCKVYEDLNIL